MNILKFIPIISMLVVTQSFAGNEGGGGVGFLCGNKVYLADTYDTMKSNAKHFREEYSEMSVDQIIFEAIKNADTHRKLLEHVIKDFDPDKKDKIEEAKNVLKYLDTNLLKEKFAEIKFKSSKDVPYVGDDKIVDIPKRCKKIPIAYQNIEKSEVLYDRTYYAGLSKVDKAYLKIHELLINIEGGTDDTTPIRKAVSIITNLQGITKIIENKQQKCNMKSYVQRAAWTTLRALHSNYENIDYNNHRSNNKLTGKYTRENALKNDLKDYIEPDKVNRFIEESYTFLIIGRYLINKKDPNPYPENENIYRVRNHYMDQSWQSGYSTVITAKYSELSICDYLIMVEQAFKIDSSRSFGRYIIKKENQ